MTFRAPDADHPLFGPYWQPARAGHLNLPSCTRCQTVLWPPTELCPECLCDEVHWSEQPGDGVVWSTAEYHRAYSPALAEEVPYTCVLVQLDCGPRLIARVAKQSDVVNPGDRVGVVRETTPTGQSVPCFASSVWSSR